MGRNSVTNDETILNRMGYRQELARGFTAFMSFRPGVLIWAWIVCGLATIIIGSNMAEICSSYPSAGSVYHWAGSLGSEEYAPFLSYVCGWFNTLGNAAGDAAFGSSFAYGVAGLLTLTNPDGYVLTANDQTWIAIGACAFWALQNFMKINHMGWLNNFSFIFQVGTTLAIVITLFVTCSSSNNVSAFTPSSLQDMFFSYYSLPDTPSMSYVILIGMLTPLYSLSGYEAAGHLSEETKEAQKAAPIGIFYCCVVSVMLGFLFILGMNYTVASSIDIYNNGTYSPQQIFVQVTGESWGLLFSVLLVVATYFAGSSSLTVTTRIVYAMARDGAFPFSKTFAKVWRTNQVPVGAILLTFGLDAFLLLLNLVNSTAFVAITSITIIGYQISYAIPIIQRVQQGKKFYKATFNLGNFGVYLGTFSAAWLIITSFLFLLPTSFPITSSNMNWSSVVTGGFILIGGMNWMISGRYNFKGPKRFDPAIHLQLVLKPGMRLQRSPTR